MTSTRDLIQFNSTHGVKSIKYILRFLQKLVFFKCWETKVLLHDKSRDFFYLRWVPTFDHLIVFVLLPGWLFYNMLSILFLFQFYLLIVSCSSSFWRPIWEPRLSPPYQKPKKKLWIGFSRPGTPTYTIEICILNAIVFIINAKSILR